MAKETLDDMSESIKEESFKDFRKDIEDQMSS
jgi:hypothetical protein